MSAKSYWRETSWPWLRARLGKVVNRVTETHLLDLVVLVGISAAVTVPFIFPWLLDTWQVPRILVLAGGLTVLVLIARSRWKSKPSNSPTPRPTWFSSYNEDEFDWVKWNWDNSPHLPNGSTQLANFILSPRPICVLCSTELHVEKLNKSRFLEKAGRILLVCPECPIHYFVATPEDNFQVYKIRIPHRIEGRIKIGKWEQRLVRLSRLKERVLKDVEDNRQS